MCQLKHTNALPNGRYEVLSPIAKRGLQPKQHVYIKAKCGCFLRVKVNGKPHIWLRQPHRVEVPYKYGLYEYGCITKDTEARIPLVKPAQLNLV